MKGLNKVQIIGHLSQDPEVKYMPIRYYPMHLKRLARPERFELPTTWFEA